MTFPVAPIQVPAAQGSKDILPYQWINYHNQLSTQLRTKLNDQGYQFPGVSQTNLNNIEQDKSQSIVYNQDTTRMNVNNNSEYEEIATRPKKTLTQIQAQLAQEGIGMQGRIFVDTTNNTMITTLDGSTLVTLQTV